MKGNYVILVGMFIMFSVCVNGANPILPGYADPHMKVWGGKMFVSVGKDESPDNKDFFITHWDIFSSTDMVNWKIEAHINPRNTYLGAGYKYCWASDITLRDNKYYFYFSNHGEATGVLVADKPQGPYLDVLKKPMISSDFSINHEYDPTIFEDDNDKYYIIYGRDGKLGTNLLHYQIAELAKDMVSLAEPPRDLITSQEYGFGAANRAQDHQYFHKRDGIYYLSCAGAYMTSENIYGPYSNIRHTGQNGHSSFCQYNGQWYQMTEWSCQPYNNRTYRQVTVTYLHYKDNGDMVADKEFLEATNAAQNGRYFATGVANYNARWDKIESEWFFKSEGKLLKRESPSGGFEMQNINTNDYLIYPKIDKIKVGSTIDFSISSAIKSGARIEIRQNNPDGKVLGVCKVKSTGSWSNYKTFSTKLNIENDDPIDLCFVFMGGEGDLLHLDWFRLKAGSKN